MFLLCLCGSLFQIMKLLVWQVSFKQKTLYLTTKTNFMDTLDTSPGNEQVIVPSSPNPLSSTKNILLLVAALLVLVGFFLPWINPGGGGYDNDDYDYESEIPTINGIYLISNVNNVPEVGWLLTIFMLLVPVGALIVAYNTTRRSFSEKAMTFGIAAAAFIPISLLALYLLMPGRGMWGDLIGSRVKLGIGFIMMGAGGVYCLFYAIARIGQHMKNISAGPLFKFGAIGGVITAVIIYLVMDNISSPGTSMAYIYLFLVIAGLLLSVYIHSTGDNVNYHSGLVVGFIFSATYVFTLLIISSIENSRATARVGEVLLFTLVFHSLFGFVISSLIATTRDSTGTPESFEFETTAENVAGSSNPEQPQA
jgi:hypothetical protein